MSCVYILHLDRPLKHARHYIGFAVDLERRIAHHRAGTGARFTQVLHEQGIGFTVARTWDGADKNFERRLKNCKHAADYCPLCSWERTREYHPKEKSDTNNQTPF